MGFLIDTNVVFELARKEPSERVIAWMKGTPPDLTFLSVVSLGELWRGVDLLPRGKRREALRAWLEGILLDWADDRLLSISPAIAKKWGHLRHPDVCDGLIAATALVHDLTLVTRNVADFQIAGLEVVNPWD